MPFNATLVSWPFLIAQLRRYGVTMSQIADYAETSEANIHRIASDYSKEPKFSTGVLLLDLAFDKLPRPEFARLKEEINQ